MKQRKPLKAVIRVDGGQRTHLKDFKGRRAAAREAAKNAPPIEDTRVREVWARQEARDRAAARKAVEDRKVKRLQEAGGGQEGARLASVRIKVSAYRQERTLMRCAPGTFEWQYGRNKQDLLFHAGSHLARLWERAGIAITSSADFLRGTAAGYATGISSARLANIEKLNGFVTDVGRQASDRLVAYCVEGLTSTEVARTHGIPQRDIAAVLRQDLKACAEHFNYVGKRR